MSKVDKELILSIIDDWKMFWSNQYQHSEHDFKNYSRRAFGVDANMKHHLADTITKVLNGEIEKDHLNKKTQEILDKYGRRF